MRRWRVALILLGVVAVAGCDRSADGRDGTAEPRAQLRRIATIRGVGATFPYPIYARWALAYFEQEGVRLRYEAVGSDGAVKAVLGGRADFGATDIPLGAEQLAKHGLVQFPVVVGAVALVVHLPGVDADRLCLTPEVLAAIYLGAIRRWDDAAIQALNPELRLPAADVIPVYRAGRSGTTWLFTHYLSEVSPAWRDQLGRGAQISWPVGVGAGSNEQVAKFVGQFKYTIGYVQLAYALQHGLACPRLRNRDGAFVAASYEAAQAAAERGAWVTRGVLEPALTNQSGPDAWPITGASYAVLARAQDDKARARRVLAFFEWALTQGRTKAQAIQYVTVPKEHVAAIAEIWREQIRVEGQPIW